jgi:DNA-binding FadR family transcriptional regulator
VHLHDETSHRLGIAIIGGALKPGDTLPNEDDYSAQLGVGRSVYREAVRFLAGKGLVEARRKRGTVVLPRERWNFLDPDVLAWFFEVHPDGDFIRNLVQLRLIIEPPAAELAARNRQPRHLEVLRAALAELRDAPLGGPAGRDAGSRFHRTVLAATGNEVLASLSSSIDAAVRWTLTYMRRRHVAIPNPFEPHERLYRAIEQQDTAAARDIMRGIVSDAYEAALDRNG